MSAGPVPDAAVVVVAGAVALAVWQGSIVPGALLLLVGLVWSSTRAGRPLACFWLIVLGFVVLGALRSERAWSGLEPDRLGPFAGWAELVDDPQTYGASTRVLLRIDGERFEWWVRGRAAQLRVAEWRAGQHVALAADRRDLADDRAGRVAWQHVVGRLDVEWVSDVVDGSAVSTASNRVRATLEEASTVMPADQAALYRGLVIGDDRDQPTEMIERFRASGLSHLTAVSGQNIVLLLAACGPLLRRLGTGARWVCTVGLIGWFVLLTRVEPSILRAGVMAVLAITAQSTGREHSPVRALGLAVAVLLLVDPLLCWSVGFWLSVGATGGVVVVGPWLAARLVVFGPLAVPLGITLGAQLGVALPSVLVFERLPLVSVPANLLAVPVAGLVMLYGLPAGVLAGLVPPLRPLVMWPAGLGTRWVDTVAALGARLEPPPPWPAVGWVLVLLVVVACCVRARGPTVDEPP